MFQSLQIAFGGYLGAFYASLVPTTQPLREYVARGFEKSMAWTPGRMIDSAEEMLAAWQRNDTDEAPTQPPKLPVILIAMAKDYTPSPRDFNRQIADPLPVILPEDPGARVFGLRTLAGDFRTQLAIFAADGPTAQSLASQFCLYLDATANRRFTARYTFGGQDLDWPVQIETPENPAVNVRTEVKNLSILAVDLTLRTTVPLFEAPKEGDPSDGNGGYPVVGGVNSRGNEAP